jgi:hypothetical protein
MRRISLYLCVSFSLIAQNQKGDYSISGTVVNSQTGEPVKSALVTFSKMAADAPDSFQVVNQKPVLAGIGGEFQLTGPQKASTVSPRKNQDSFRQLPNRW